MEKSQLENIQKLPGLKKKVIRQTILAMINIHHDFPIRYLMENSNFEYIIKGELQLKNNGEVIQENINIEFIDVIQELINEELTKFNQFNWLVANKKFKKKYFEDLEEDFGLDFIGNDDSRS